MVAQSVARILGNAGILGNHVKLSVECIDRMYLNVYVPKLQREKDAAWFFRGHRQQPFASSALMAPMSRRFVAGLERYARAHEIEVVQFRPDERKDDVMAERLKRFDCAEGVVFIGKAQEKASVFRTEKRRLPNGQSYPWIVRSTAMVNQYYIYAVDRDFGPFFLKFSSYFPYNAKLCLNGHEHAKRQLAKAGIAFEALDNGIQSCAAPERLAAICDGLSDAKIDALLRMTAVGFDTGGVDGRFSQKTEVAVKDLQQRSHLTVDGVVGPQTWAVVDALENEGGASRRPAAPE